MKLHVEMEKIFRKLTRKGKLPQKRWGLRTRYLAAGRYQDVTPFLPHDDFVVLERKVSTLQYEVANTNIKIQPLTQWGRNTKSIPGTPRQRKVIADTF
jgi:hypothetical protein